MCNWKYFWSQHQRVSEINLIKVFRLILFLYRCRPGNWENCELNLELTPPSTTPSTTTTTVHTTTAVSNPCEGVFIGNVPMAGNCTMYYACFNSIPQPQTCPQGQIFDRNLLSCVVGNENECDLFNYLVMT